MAQDTLGLDIYTFSNSNPKDSPVVRTLPEKPHDPIKITPNSNVNRNSLGLGNVFGSYIQFGSY